MSSRRAKQKLAAEHDDFVQSPCRKRSSYEVSDVEIFRKNPGGSISVLHLMNCPGDFYRFCIAVWFVLADVITFYHGLCVKSYFFRQKMSYLRNV